jgi:hypothetical protein
MWTPGETFADSLLGLTLRVDAETPDGFDVTITRGWTLRVGTTGEGQIAVFAGTVNDVSCPAAACSHLYPIRGTTVQLVATPTAGWALRGWSGACSGATVCTVTMGSNQTVGAVFEQQLAVSAILARLFGQAHELRLDDLLFLDQIGNSNDRFDLGDVRAYLTYTGVLGADRAALAPSAAPHVGESR